MAGENVRVLFNMILAAVPSNLSNLSKVRFDYFDVFVIIWLLIGVVVGRRRGMSQEILPTLQWVGIVVAAGIFYHPFSLMVHQYAAVDMLWSSVFSYVLIGFGVHLVYLFIKKAIGEKLNGTDLFGRSEYYLGMAAGAARFACMLVALLALMNARIISKTELAQTEKMQRDNFSDIRFPTYGSVQQAVLFDSFTGSLIESNLQAVLIYPVPASKTVKRETLAHQKEDVINEVLSGGKK